MSLRFFCLFALALLAACSSKPPAPVHVPSESPTSSVETPLPANLRELTGVLASSQGYLPVGSEVELALLVMDARDRPQQTLSSLSLHGTGGALPFHLRFDPQSFPAGARVELHARVAQGGQLAWRLRPLPIAQAQSQALGELRLVPAP